MIQQAIACDDPVIFFEPKRRYWDKGEVDTDAIPAAAARAPRVVRPGTDAHARGLRPDGEDAAWRRPRAAEEGTSSRSGPALAVADRLRPVSSVGAATGRLVVVHEAPVVPRLGAEIAARVTERCFYHLEAPVLRVGGFTRPTRPSRLEDEYLPDLDRVLDAVDRSLAY